MIYRKGLVLSTGSPWLAPRTNQIALPIRVILAVLSDLRKGPGLSQILVFGRGQLDKGFECRGVQRPGLAGVKKHRFSKENLWKSRLAPCADQVALNHQCYLIRRPSGSKAFKSPAYNPTTLFPSGKHLSLPSPRDQKLEVWDSFFRIVALWDKFFGNPKNYQKIDPSFFMFLVPFCSFSIIFR